MILGFGIFYHPTTLWIYFAIFINPLSMSGDYFPSSDAAFSVAHSNISTHVSPVILYRSSKKNILSPTSQLCCATTNTFLEFSSVPTNPWQWWGKSNVVIIDGEIKMEFYRIMANIDFHERTDVTTLNSALNQAAPLVPAFILLKVAFILGKYHQGLINSIFINYWF